jgi:RimJ/RimL family protein N-acetyltransferase
MIHFRTLDRGDLPLMHRWLNTPHVVEWWPDEALTLDQIIAKYAPRIDGKEDVRCFLIVRGDAPIGYIEEYPVAEDSEYAAHIAAAERAAGIDLFIGEVEFHHRGLGAPIIRQFLNDVVFADSAVESCIIDPAVSNRGAIRAYKKAGFRFLKTVTNPGTAEAQYLMRIGREEFAQGGVLTPKS